MAQYELDHLRKIVRMMNSRTTSLDHILYIGTTSMTREGIGYHKVPSEIKLAIYKNSHLKFAKIKETIQTPEELEHHVGTKKTSS